MGQKICPEKKLENGFFSKIDVAIVGWCRSFKLDLALAHTPCHFSKWVKSKNKSGNGFPGQRGLYRVRKYQLEKIGQENFEF